MRSDVGGKFEGVLGRKMERRGKEWGRKEGNWRKKRENGRTRKRERGRKRKKEMGRIVKDEYYDVSISHKH